MTQRLGDVLAAGIREHRKRRDLSIRALAEECARIAPGGTSLTAASLSNIERGQTEGAKRRPRDVTAEELLILAAALRVPVVELLCPPGFPDDIEIVPGVPVPGWAGADWITAMGPYPGLDALPHEAREQYDQEYSHNLYGVATYRTLRELTEGVMAHRRLVAADLAYDEFEEEVVQARWRSITVELLRRREEMRKAGLPVPPLPDGLDEDDLKRSAGVTDRDIDDLTSGKREAVWRVFEKIKGRTDG